MKAAKAVSLIRKKMGLTQEALASKLGVSFTSVNRWENGRTEPLPGAARKIEKLLLKAGGKRRSVERSKKALVAYSLFAGAGGFHLGMRRAGIQVAVATDIEPVAELTHGLNWPKTPFLCEDIRRVMPEDLIVLADGRKPDMLFGGPPCQGFSTLGDKLSNDPRNDLFEAYIRLVAALEPKCLLIENVKALATMYRGRFLQWIVRRLSELGYTVYTDILNAADYGVPQIRHRVILFATTLNHAFAFPNPSHGNSRGMKPYMNVGPAIMDLANKGSEIPSHIALNHSETVMRRYQYIPEGGRLPPPEELPKDIRRKNFGNTYKRLHRERPSLTMVPGNNAFPVHPTLDRSLTPREAARIQSFPDSFRFSGDRRRQCILVGNAVPPRLAEVLGKQVIAHARGRIPAAKAAAPEQIIVAISEGSSALEEYLDLPHLSKLPAHRGFVDLFAGAGGFTIGLARGGWRPLLCADFSRSVALTHKANYPSVPFAAGDLSDRAVKKLILEKLAGDEVGIVVGGPPCQGFSIFGKRRFVNTKGYDPHSDPRNRLVYAFLDYVKAISPRWFVMENVAGISNLDGGMFLGKLVEEFRANGYPNAEYRVLNAAHYGVPQLRKRLLIIGNRTGHIIPWPKQKFFEEPEEWQSPFRVVGEVISDLSDDDSYDRYTCHVPMKHKPLLVERYKYIEEGGKLNVDALPNRLRKGYRTDRVKNYSHVFKRLHRDRPSITMVPGHNAFPIHPWLHRALTVREAARIQTFPDEIVFQGSRQEQCIQVGNAFPTLWAETIANGIQKAETNGWFPGSVPASAYYALVEEERGPHNEQVGDGGTTRKKARRA